MAANNPTTDEVLQKLTTNDMSDGGLLKPEEFSSFFEGIQGRSDLLGRVRGVPVEAPSGALPRLSVGSRLFKQVDEGKSSAEVSDINQPSVNYQTVKMGGHVPITWEVQNESIGNVEDSIISQLVSQFTLDLETLGSVGDESSSDQFESINDGWLTTAKASGATTYNHAEDNTSDSTSNPTPQPVDKTLFSGMLEKLPERYKETQSLAFLMSYDQKQAYREWITERQTSAGDRMLMTEQEPTGWGHEIITPKAWPDDEVMLTNLDNLVYIIQRNVRVRRTTDGVETVKKDLHSLINLLAHTDYLVLDGEGVVVGQNVEAPTP